MLIGGASFAGNLSIETDSIANTASSLTLSRLSGGGSVWFLPNTSATAVTFNGTGAGLELTSSILSALTGFAEIKAGYKFGTGALSVAAPYTAASNTNLILNAGGALTVANALTTSGTGSITLESARNVEISANVTTANGDIRVLANTDLFSWQSPPYTSASVTFGARTGSFVGVNIGSGADLTTTAGGTIAIAGKGGTTGGNGVFVGDGSVIAAGSAGSVSIVGAGAATSAHGVELYQITAGTNSIVAGGAISIVGGNGSGGDANWFGVAMNGAGISGASSISITGRGGANGSGIGLYIINGAVITSTGAGSITLTGETANAGSSGFILSGGSVSASGTGSISLVSSKNVSIGGNVTTASGDILITGNVASWAPSYATNAPVFGTASGNFIGVDITANVTSSGGNIAIAGKGGDSSSYNHGVVTTGSPSIAASGAGAVTIHGQGGPSTTHVAGNGAHIGVNFGGGSISTVDGTLKVVGTGGGAGTTDNNAGVQVFNTFVGSNGLGNVVVAATGGNGGSRGYVGAGTFGVYAQNGTLTLTGVGGTGYYLSGDGYNWHSTGVEVSGGSVINARGAGLLSVTGTGGGAGTGANVVGVSVLSGGLIKAEGTGGATIVGTGGNGSGTGNHGVVLNNSNVESTGSGGLLVTGTAGVGTGPLGLSFAGASVTVGGATHTGNTTLRADSISNTATTLTLSRQAGGGTITFRTDTDATTMGVAGGTGALQVTAALLSTVSGFQTQSFGSATQTGAINLAGITLARDTTVAVNSAGVYLASDGNPLALNGRTLTVSSITGNVVQSGGITGAGTLALTGGGDVLLTSVSNTLTGLQLSKAGTTGYVNLSTTGSLSLATSTMGTGALTLVGAGFVQTGGLTQDALGGAVSISGGANAVTFGQA
ncbi:MAG: hypothetical protein ING29_12055, partial [Azospirillum sp.]|nr:hypothetical protein [Azospirillum sp.]